MIKLFVFLFGVLLLATTALSQQPILDDHYEWQLFITDATGNQDTLTFGTHPLAKANQLVSMLDEFQISIPDTIPLFFVINKSDGLTSKRSFGVTISNGSIKNFGFFMDSIFYKSIYKNEPNSPIFIIGKARNYPLKLRMKQIYRDSSILGYQNLMPWRIYIGEYNQTDINFQLFFGGQYDTAYVLSKSDIKFRNDGLIPMYIQFVNFIVAYEDKIISEISIFPNPGNNLIHIINTGKSVFKSYSIFDYAGKVIDIGNKLPAEINTTNFHSGFYTIIFKTSDGKRDIKKFVISR
ncbi:MAG: T9SS type A sorting domain-containing protein [Saprospiraceae bacterium]